MDIRLPAPDLQVDFSASLAVARKLYLIDALSDQVGKMEIPRLDAQLADFVPSESMRLVASTGLRAEYVFPVPMVLAGNPRLLSYYRLLLGHSRKAFYDGRTGVGMFRSMEDVGSYPGDGPVACLCREMVSGLTILLESIGPKRLSREVLDDLTLLTLGPQFRGEANVKKGSAGITAVFDLIQSIVRPCIKTANEKKVTLENAAGRRVTIEFAADPDIVIREMIGKDSCRNVVAIEVKGGTDFSNIHNRIGEAEKSHQKARQTGYVECWTIVNVHKLDVAKAKKESPSTDRFFRLSELLQTSSTEYTDFRNRVASLTGLPERSLRQKSRQR